MAYPPDASPVPAAAGAPTLKGQLGWALYDMAGGPYFNFVKIFVFAPYFARSIVGDDLKGQELWGYIDGAAGLGIALLSSIVGSMANVYGPRKPLMAGFSVVVVLSLLLLWFAAPGSPAFPIAALLVLVSIAAELSFLCHGSLLTLVAPPQRIGFVSGLGYSFNYLGTLIIAVLWLAVFGAAMPITLLDRTLAEEVRIVAPLSGLWFLLCAIPFFLFTPDEGRRGPSLAKSVSLGLGELKKTLLQARRYANIMRFLIARMIYFDGLVATFTFIGIFATGNFGWAPTKVGVFGLVIFSVIVFAAFLGGLIDDLIGSKRTILIGIVAVMASVALALGAAPDTIFYVVELSEEANAALLPLVGSLLAQMGFATLAEQYFILCGILGGIFMGPALASSRTLLARIAPQSMMAEFFGLFTLTGKATSFIAPIAIAFLTRASGSQRIGIAAVFVFLLVGLLGLSSVREVRADAAS